MIDQFSNISLIFSIFFFLLSPNHHPMAPPKTKKNSASGSGGNLGKAVIRSRFAGARRPAEDEDTVMMVYRL